MTTLGNVLNRIAHTSRFLLISDGLPTEVSYMPVYGLLAYLTLTTVWTALQTPSLFSCHTPYLSGYCPISFKDQGS